jgi:hypothetical protein
LELSVACSGNYQKKVGRLPAFSIGNTPFLRKTS